MYSVRLDGRDVRRLASQISDAAVSPDRSEVAFEDDSGFPGGIAVIRVDGSHERLLDAEQESVIDGSPAWSPDGRRVVFVRTTSPAPSGALFASVLYTIDANGTGRRRLAGSAVDSPGPSWINERQILITTGQGELAIISATTGKVERLITLPRAGTQPAPEPAALAPSGRELAYVECDNEDCSSASVDVITMRGELLRRIVGAHTPAWTPQGNLLYACCQQAGISGNTSVIVMTPAQRGKARTLTATRFSADYPRWLGLRAAR
jgi:Tol biopolymer transport system component